MEAHKRQKVRIRYRCSLQDGRICHIGEGDSMEFWLGAGPIAPSLADALAGMQPGERRVVRVPAAEVPLIPFPKENESPPGIGYEFGPGDAGDVDEYIPPRPRHPREEIPAGSDLDLEIQLLSVEEPASE